MKRVFVFQDFKSQKFWSIDLQGNGFTVNYGKLGTEGQFQEKTFASPEEAEKQANKLIAEKTKKGYVETAEEAAKEMKVEAKKYKLSYDDYDNGKTQKDLLDKILNDKKLADIKQLTIGCWDYESGDCQELVDGMIAHKEKFAHIEGLFWGDIDGEESEVSWIEQTDLSVLLDGMPKLKDLKIKGTNGLSIGQKQRPEIISLEIISGGLPTSVVDDVIKSDFPNLEKLILYVGVDDYGYDGSIDQFKPLFSKNKFPKLNYLGIINAVEEDQVVELFLSSDILPQLETMDISAGVLTDKGGQLLLDNVDKLKHLKFIDMEYNYLTEEMQKKLSQLPVKVNVSDAQDIDEDYEEWGGFPLITE
ncbi:STM4015 family protein [Parabacteroides sp. PF5-9]|uniref:STM4015 family protein n=1 Tax=Parabacteroides sp. PF5-9 TaxID=1742404 RepID=UPI0024768F00|nr:STM4015 family protein [Parabacteroides sp. PF5-9]MDH6358514.1 putative DNA-binding WGR domain protein [Parabacteroides sp. PF5-9]